MKVICDSLLIHDTLELTHPGSCLHTCAIIREDDVEFGEMPVFDPRANSDRNEVILPSERIDRASISHLNDRQQNELIELLDRYQECFVDRPGFTEQVEHVINLTEDFKPKRMKAYRIPERLKGEVDKQIQEMLDQGIIVKSTSPMACPLVCVLKVKDGCDGVRLAVDYRYVNKYTVSDAFPIQDISSLVQKIGQAKYITVCDAKSGY